MSPLHKHTCTFILLAGVFLLAAVGCTRSAQAYLNRGNALASKGKYAEAALNYRNAIQKDHRFGEALFQLGLADIHLGNGTEAYNALALAENLMPNRQDVKVQLGDLILAKYFSSPQPSPNLYDQLGRISRQLLTRNPNSVDGLRFQGDLAVIDGSLDQAIEAFRKANAASPMRPDVIGPWVDALLKSNRTTDAEQLAKQFIQTHNDSGPMYDALYRIYMGQNRYQDAENLLKYRVKTNPTNNIAIVQLAGFYYQQSRNADMTETLRVLSENPKRFPHGQADVGDFYFQSKNWQRAVDYYESGLRTDRKNKTFYERKIVNVLVAQNKREDALKLLSQILKEQPNDIGSRSLHAELLISSGNPSEVKRALGELEQLAHEQPSNSIIQLNLGRACALTGDLTKARTSFLEAAKLKPDFIAPRLALAEVGERTRNYGEVLQYGNEVLAIKPDDRTGQYWRCVGLVGTGQYDRARAELNQFLQSSPDSMEAQLQLALLDGIQKRYKDAETIYRKLYRPGQADPRPLQGLVRVYVSQNQFPEALALLAIALKASPESVPIRSSLASTAVRAGKLDVAEEQYEWITARNTTAAADYVSLANVYVAKGELEKALSTLEKARRIAPADPNVLGALGNVEAALGQNTRALADFKQQLVLQPNDPTIMNNVAFLLAETGGDLDEALRLATVSREKFPDNAGVADTIGWVYLKKRMNDSAAQVFSSLVRRFPNDPAYRYHLAVALLQQGQTSKARTELQTALAAKPTPDLAQKIKEAVARLGQGSGS